MAPPEGTGAQIPPAGDPGDRDGLSPSRSNKPVEVKQEQESGASMDEMMGEEEEDEKKEEKKDEKKDEKKVGKSFIQ